MSSVTGPANSSQDTMPVPTIAPSATSTTPNIAPTRAERMRQRDRKRQRRNSTVKVDSFQSQPALKGGTTIVSADNVYKEYRKGKLAVPVLKGVSLSVKEGEFCSIVGKSGSGKSTLLHLLGTLDVPNSGEIHYRGERIDNIATRKRDKLRNQKFGLIFQFYHLLPELTTLENVLMPRMISDSVFTYLRNKRRHVERAEHLLETVGLSHRLKHRPSELSGGEMQRVAIARALVSNPELLLADEPTGNLDAAAGAEVLEILDRLRAEEKLTIVMVTHDDSIAARADRCVRLVSGKVQQA